nr:hypothetical protein [Tanacetum cinerariifolium]
MSRDVLTVGSTMRILLLYRGEYSQWVERFMNYLEEQTDGEAMINSIKNGDQPLPHVTQVSIAETTSTEQPPLKDKSINKTAKDLWDALARHILGSKYGEQERKAAVLYEYETFKATKGELLLHTYIRYLQVINDLKKCGYSKDNCELNFKSKEKVVVSSNSEGSEADDFSELKKIIALLAKAFNRRKFYSKPRNNILRTSSFSQSANKKQEFVKSDNKKVGKKADEKKRDMSIVKCYNFLSDSEASSSSVDAKISEVSYYLSESETNKNNLRTSSTSQSAKKKQEFVKTDNKKVEKKDDEKKRDMSRVKCYNYQEINANMVFMAQIEKVLFDSEASSSSVDEKISEVLKGQLQVKHLVIDTHAECQEKYAKLEAERYEYMIRYSAYFDNDKQHRKQIAN